MPKPDLKSLAEAIDRYLAKADEDLVKTLTDEGFIEAEAAVDAVNRIEDAVVDITQKHFDTVIDMVSTEQGLKELVEMTVPEYAAIGELEDDLKRVFRNEFDRMVRQFSFSFLIAQDPGLDITDHMIAQETQEAISTWSRYLGGTTAKWLEPGILDTIQEAVEAGNDVEGVTKILYESGIRDTEWKARRLAVTEVLRMESMGQQDSFIQNPSCYKKKWVYTWQAAEPRQHHIAMDGQEVFKRDPFTLRGPNGTFYPMYPRDCDLPAGESINCHCRMQEVVDENILGMTEEERSDLRRKALEEADTEWQAEHAHDNINMYKSMTEEQQLRYFGGKKKGKPYKSLIDSGVITTDDQLKQLYGTDATGRRYQKGLKELNADGIFTVDENAIKHTMVGKWSKLENPKLPPGRYGKNGEKNNGGNMKSGGHAFGTIAELKKKGIPCDIKKVYDNGVLIGGYDGADFIDKKLGMSGMSWFPEGWSESKIRDAGTFVANRYAICNEMRKDGKLIGYQMFANYDGVTVGIFTNPERNPQTIYPDALQRLLGGKND